MAMLPVLLDMVDEIYNSLDEQSKTFPDSIPMLFVPQRSGNGRCGQGMRFRCGGGPPKEGCPCAKGAGCGRKCQRGACAVRPKTEEFQISLNVKSYKPEEITVKVKDHEIIVDGKHEERADEFGFVSRQFSRRLVLPQEFDPDTVSTFLNAENIMTIKALKPQPAAVETNERIIPIQRVPSASTEVPAAEQEQGWEKVEDAEADQPKKVEEPKKE